MLVVVISTIIAVSIFTVLFTVLRNRSPYIIQDPIIIWTDGDFEYYNFPGDGTQGNPFIIENYNITSESGYGIFIGDTTKHIVIRNCYINAHYDGIHVENVAANTIIIENNECINSLNGIAVIGSYYTVIANNTCKNNYQNGISLHHTDYSTTIDNNCNYNGNTGIHVSRTYFSTVTENNCSGNGVSGIYFEHGYNITINNNYCGSNDFGISLHSSEFIETLNNIIMENKIGIDFNEIDNSTIRMNFISGNIQYAIKIAENPLDLSAVSQCNVIYHNSFFCNNPGGFSQAYCDFANNSWYNTVLMEGNWWDDWVSGTYIIEGPILIEDLYPLTESPHEEDL